MTGKRRSCSVGPNVVDSPCCDAESFRYNRSRNFIFHFADRCYIFITQFAMSVVHPIIMGSMQNHGLFAMHEGAVMIPVYQTMTVANDGCGNCFNACVASILELPLRDVAQIHPKDKRYWGPWREWFSARGIALVERSAANPPKGWAIACGDGFRTYPDDHEKAGLPIIHACVAFNGEVLHDPFPGGKGLASIHYFWELELIAREKEA